MKTRTILVSAAILMGTQLFAGDFVTNSNHSAQWTRMLSRNAVIDADATYYNPSALNFLPKNGLFVSLNNQVISQERTIKSSYPALNDGSYTGKIFVPAFPSIYAGYKTDKFTISGGFMIAGGGGGATYDRGLPAFEYGLTDLIPGLASQGVNAYRANIHFEGTSVFYGYQLNFSYKINDQLSIAVGGRLVYASESYKGYLRNVEVYNYYKNPNNWTRADAIMQGAATSFTNATKGSQALIDNGAGAMTFAQVEGAGYISATNRAELEGALTALGYPAATPISSANAIFSGAAAQYGAKAMLLGDQEADTKRTGIGFAPIIAIDFKPNEQLNIGLKYTHQANIELEYETAKDFTTGMKPDGTPITKFPDGQKNRLDMPSTLSLGATYKPIEKLLVSVSCDYFFDKQADWSGRQDSLDGNGIEAGIGLEYSLTEKLALSTGYMYSKPGIAAGCQSDMGFELNAHSIAFGARYKLNEMIEINAGIEYSAYEDFDKNFTRNAIAYKETYGKQTLIGGIGLNLYFGK